MTQIPVLLLTGYLGSGKTTLLNRILSNEKGIKFAVIVNDIGEVNIDADLIQQGGVVNKQDDSLVALQNGCICCTLKMDLIDQLRDIINMKRFDYIVIEASGICEPAPIAQTISSMATLGPQYITNGIPRLDSIVTVVDALRMRDEFNNGDALTRDGLEDEDLENLVIQQIEFCNTILLNKAAEVSADDLRKLTEIIRAIQPKAEIIPCNYGDVDLERLLNTGRFNFNEVATSAAWINELENHHGDEEDDDDDEEEEHEHHHHDHDGECGCGHHHDHHDGECGCGHHHDHEGHHHADDVFTSWGVETAHKFTEDELKEILDKLAKGGEYGEVLRAKGIVTPAEGEWFHFDLVPEETELRRGAADYTGRICVIGANLNEDKLKELFHV